MDFMPDKEFHEIFDRVSRIVDLKGCRTQADVIRRLKQKIKQQIHAANNPLAKIRATNEATFLKKLIPAFAKRVIDEAHAEPQGEIALTLKHGRKKAEILFGRLQRRLGFNRKWKRKRRR